MYKERKYIRGIVDELMSNSLKAGASSVQISIDQADDAIVIRVEDDGKGMTPSQLKEVEHRLNRPRRDELEEYYGALAGESLVGSGLAIVGMLVDKAEVKSEQGKGTVITLFRKLHDQRKG